MTDDKSFGTYRKPSGALAAYPVLRTCVDVTLLDGTSEIRVVAGEKIRFVSAKEYTRLLARAKPM